MTYSITAINTLVTCTLFPILAIIAVGLRFLARHIKALPIKLDDISICLALVASVATGVTCIYGAVHGEIGVFIAYLTPQQGVTVFKLLFAVILLHLTSLTFIKLSILLFYKRIFVGRAFKTTVNATIALVVLWWTSFFITLFLSATPISTFWEQHETVLNYNFGAMVLALVCLDLAVDLWILCLPLPIIAKLHMQKKQKWQLVAMFSLGFFCVVSSAVRIYYVNLVNELPNFTSEHFFLYVLSNNFIWAVIEPNASVVAACLPTLGPLFRQWRGVESIVNSVRSIFSISSLRGSGNDSHELATRTNKQQQDNREQAVSNHLNLGSREAIITKTSSVSDV